MTEPKQSWQRPPCFATGAGIICAGLPRSGTASLSKALEILGFDNIHHGLLMHAARPREFYGWGQAAWCHFPSLQANGRGPEDRLPFYVNPADPLTPWARGDWDRLIGSYRVTTDFGALFSEQLITNYPEARVILVQRPVADWATSFRAALLDGICYGARGFVFSVVGPWVGETAGRICKDVFLGYLGASSRDEAIRRLPAAHGKHGEMVRQIVPADQLLEYKLGDGWGPLCEFLGVPVPDVPFPHINDTSDLITYLNMVAKRIVGKICIRFGSCAALVVCLTFMLRVQNRGWIKSLFW